MPWDDTQFAHWVAQQHATALRLARRIVAHEADAADVVQESFARAYEALRAGRYRSTEAEMGAWLRAIVTRASLDALRARRRRREDGDHALESVEAPLYAVAGERADLERAVLDLPAEQRTAFVLREIEGRSLKETAAALGCSVGAVEQRVHRAWAGLKRRLLDEPG
jgi:RNA polymerase sigma-70 factor (ECF subfamily)